MLSTPFAHYRPPNIRLSLTCEICSPPSARAPSTASSLPAKDRGRLRGLSLTKPGTLLRDQIPVQGTFNRDERKPGFFEFDRATHCGTDASGQCCQTLTGTDGGSGWTEEHALLNSAHRWVKERIQHIRDELPFPLLGVDRDTGGEFINHQLTDGCDLNHIQFSRGRPYRKNDHCFVEQKSETTFPPAMWCVKPCIMTALRVRTCATLWKRSTGV